MSCFKALMYSFLLAIEALYLLRSIVIGFCTIFVKNLMCQKSLNTPISEKEDNSEPWKYRSVNLTSVFWQSHGRL